MAVLLILLFQSQLTLDPSLLRAKINCVAKSVFFSTCVEVFCSESKTLRNLGRNDNGKVIDNEDLVQDFGYQFVSFFSRRSG